MRTRIPGIMAAVQATAWAIVPEKLHAMLDMLELRASGVEKTNAEIAAVMRPQGRAASSTPSVGGKIAVLPLYGVVCQRAGMMTEYSGGTSTEQFAASFDAAMNNADVGAIVIDCDSPGGTTDGVPELAARIRAARGKKRIVAIANTMMASAAYWVCAQADEIVAAPSALVGSIGVFMCHTDESGADAQAGITRTLISAGKFKTEGNSYEPLSADALAAAQSMVDEYYALFVADVSAGRGVKAKDVEAGYGQGRCLPARQAMAAGLVDRIATLDQVLGELGTPGAGAKAKARRASASRPQLAAAAAPSAAILADLALLGFDAFSAGLMDLMARGVDATARKKAADDTSNGDDGKDDEEDLEENDEDFVATTDDDDTDALADDEEDDTDQPDAAPPRTRRKAKATSVTTGRAVAAPPISLPAANRPSTATEHSMSNPAEDPVALERKRVSQITALCAQHGVTDRAQAFIDEGISVEAAGHAILQAKQAAAGPAIRVGADREAEKPFKSFGEQLVAVVQAGIPGRRADPRLAHVNNRVFAGTPSGMNESVGSEGGFFIQPDLLPGVIDPVYADDPILSRITRIPIGAQSSGVKYNVVDETARTTGSRWGGVQMVWGAEADLLSSSKVKLRLMQLDLKKLIGAAYLTDELMQDAPAAEALLGRSFQAETQFMLAAAVYGGTGVGQPLGITKSGALISQAIEAAQTIANSAASLAINTSKMMSRIPASLWSEIIWLYNQELLPYLQVATLGGTSIGAFTPAGGATNKPFDSIWGRPAYASELCEAVGTPGDILCAVPSQYHMADKGGPQQAQSVHVRFLYDEMTLRWTYRTDGAPVWKTTVTPYKGATARSPFIALAARA